MRAGSRPGGPTGAGADDPAEPAVPNRRGWIKTSIERSIERGAEIGAPLRDEAQAASALRLRRIGIDSGMHPAIDTGELVSMGTIYRTAHGGSLRTFSGGLAHVCGWWPGYKRHLLQHWEGAAARDFLVEGECNRSVEWIQSEPILFRFFLAPRWFEYFADFEAIVDGVRHVVEIKRSDRDLRDPDYLLKLAAVAEICRRIGCVFRVVLADEIYAGRHHRNNCELFAMRRFARVDAGHLRRLDEFVGRSGPATSYGDLAAALEPRLPAAGAAIVQALTIRRRIGIDLTALLHDDTPVIIHSQDDARSQPGARAAAPEAPSDAHEPIGPPPPTGLGSAEMSIAGGGFRLGAIPSNPSASAAEPSSQARPGPGGPTPDRSHPEDVRMTELDRLQSPEHLPRYRMSRTAIVMIKGEPHRDLGETVPGRIHLMHLKTGQPFVRPDPSGLVSLLTPEGWDELLLAGELQVVEPPSRITARMLARQTDWDARDIAGDPDGSRDGNTPLPLEREARKMFAQVLLLDEKGIPNGVKAMTEALRMHWKGELLDRLGPHDNPVTIKRWRSQRGTVGDRLLVDFVRMWGRVPRGRYSDGVVDEVVQIVCLRGRTEPGTVQDLLDQVCTTLAEINEGTNTRFAKPEKPYPLPSYSKVYRAWRELENAYTVAAREGKAIAQAEWRGAGRPLVAKHVFQYAIMDHTRIPTVAVFDVENDLLTSEVWLTTLMDVCSRAVLAWVITAFPPSLWTVAECIRRSNLPKRPPPHMAKQYPILRRIAGRVAEVIVDNERSFRGHGLEDAAKGAGFAVRFAPIKKPTYKGVGERFFGTVLPKLAARLPGRTIPIARARKAEYDPTIKACVTLDDLEALINQAMAEYHTEDHDGLMGRQPALVFQKATGGVIDVIHDLPRFMNELLAIIPKVQVDKAGVTLWGLRYFDARLVPDLLDDLVPIEPRRQRRDDATATTKAKYNPMDIGSIKVWNRRTRKYVTLVCEHSNYAEGMPLVLHEQIRKQAQEEAAAFNTEAERMAARTRRIDAIRAIDVTATREQKEELDRLLEIPRIRQITGNIVETDLGRAVAVTLGDFIAHDVASMTSLDAEILAPRKPVSEEGSTREKRIPARDRRDAGKPLPPGDSSRSADGEGDRRDAGRPYPDQTRRPSRGGSRRVSGDYE